jgi:hypothetical protein
MNFKGTPFDFGKMRLESKIDLLRCDSTKKNKCKHTECNMHGQKHVTLNSLEILAL